MRRLVAVLEAAYHGTDAEVEEEEAARQPARIGKRGIEGESWQLRMDPTKVIQP